MWEIMMRGPIVGELCVGNYDERTYCRRVMCGKL